MMAEERAFSGLLLVDLSDDNFWKDWRDAGRKMVD